MPAPCFLGAPPLRVLRQAPCPSSPCVPLPLLPPPTRFRGSVGLSSGHSSVLTPLALMMSASGGFPFTFQWRTPRWRCPPPPPFSWSPQSWLPSGNQEPATPGCRHSQHLSAALLRRPPTPPSLHIPFLLFPNGLCLAPSPTGSWAPQC